MAGPVLHCPFLSWVFPSSKHTSNSFYGVMKPVAKKLPNVLFFPSHLFISFCPNPCVGRCLHTGRGGGVPTLLGSDPAWTTFGKAAAASALRWNPPAASGPHKSHVSARWGPVRGIYPITTPDEWRLLHQPGWKSHLPRLLRDAP